jgi:phosphopantothenoylcysteine decarboxylase/phosphopantothenate--cysteine ligase
LKRKGCDLIVANQVTIQGAGFDTDTNVVQIYDDNGLLVSLPLMHKREVAAQLLEIIAKNRG